MKRIVLIGLAVVTSILSCTKERDCTCTDQFGEVTIRTLSKDSKKTQEVECEDISLPFVLTGGNCVLD